MSALDYARLSLSLLTIGQQLLIAVLFLKGKTRSSAQWLGAVMVLGVVAYLIQKNPELRHGLRILAPITVALALAVPYLLHEFAVAIFELRTAPLHYRLAIYIVPSLAWLAAIANPEHTSASQGLLENLHYVVSLALMLLTVVQVVQQRADDLVESRRRYRIVFVTVIALAIMAVLSTEIVFGYDNIPPVIDLITIALILALNLGLGVPLLQMQGDILWQAYPRAVPVPVKDVDPLRDALESLMADGFYRTPSLTIADLATELRTPQHKLRALINKRLGFRNFSAYLNSHRIAEAKRRLRSEPDLPVLSIALDLGYGSIGPFNRAFKELTGQTPTEYRRA